MRNLVRDMLAALLVGAAITLLCHTAAAQSCGSTYSARSHRSYSTHSYGHVQKVVVKKDVYAEPTYFRYLLALPLVEVPSYGAAYVAPVNVAPVAPQAGLNPLAPPAQAQGAGPSQMQQMMSQQTQILTALDKLGKHVETLTRRVESVERTRTVQPLPLPQVAPKQLGGGMETAEAVNKAKCAVCHQKGREGDGGGFVLSDESGRFVKLTNDQLISMQRQIVRGKMPKLNEVAKKHGITALTKDEADALFAMLDNQISPK